MGNKVQKSFCEHSIGLSSKYEYQFWFNTEEDLYEDMKEEVYEDYLSYLEDKKGNPMDFDKQDYFVFENPFNYEFEFFNFCPDCGIKIDKERIKNKINKMLQQYVSTLDRNAEFEKPIKEKKKRVKDKERDIINGYVYLIKMGDSYKIGISQNPSQRFKEFTKLPYPIEEIRIEKVIGYDMVEEELHNKFADKRKRGEWFDLNESDIEFIKSYLEERKVNE